MTHEDDYVPGNPDYAGTRYLTVLTGCSGAGKSTLLRELARRGHPVVPEAGREIVKEQIHVGGTALPWEDVEAFTLLNVSRLMALFNKARPKGRPILFDRGLVDAAAHYTFRGLPVPDYLSRALALYRYAPRAFLAEPWEAIYVKEAERQKPFVQAVAEYTCLVAAYERAGYTLIPIPQGPVASRADFIEATLG